MAVKSHVIFGQWSRLTRHFGRKRPFHLFCGSMAQNWGRPSPMLFFFGVQSSMSGSNPKRPKTYSVAPFLQNSQRCTMACSRLKDDTTRQTAFCLNENREGATRARPGKCAPAARGCRAVCPPSAFPAAARERARHSLKAAAWRPAGRPKAGSCLKRAA